MPNTCIIIGGGIAGSAIALTLSKIGISSTIYELRDAPSTIGGAVNLTPNALRMLKELGVEISGCPVNAMEFFSLHTGEKMGEMAFRGEAGHALRILRGDLQQSLLAAVGNAGVPIVYGSKLVSVEDDGDNDMAKAVFANGITVEADFIIGCDGVHSMVRTQYVEPERIAQYTGAAGAYAIVDRASIKSSIHFEDTGLNMSRYGTILTGFVDSERTQIYVAAVMEKKDQESRMEWKAQGSDHLGILHEIHRRYDDSAIPCIPELVSRLKDLYLYPVYKLGPGGSWFRGRAVLVGDAAHAMPPQGESVCMALEDAVFLARIFEELPAEPLSRIFRVYETTRYPRVHQAWKDANLRWEHVKDRGWLKQKLFEVMFWGILWLKGEKSPQSLVYDVRKEKLRG